MLTHSEEFERPNGAGQRGRRPRRVDGIFLFVVVALVGVITSIIFNPAHRRSTQWLLEFGATSYTVAIVAALLLRVVARGGSRYLRLVVGSVLVGVFLWPPLFGSIAIGYALVQFVGNRPQNSEFMWGVALYAPVALLLLLLLLRPPRRRDQPANR